MFGFIKKFFGPPKLAGNGETILLVDDGEVDRALIAASLVKNGFKVLEAQNGEIGVAMAKEAQPDLIVMDMEMPIMNGQQATQIIKDTNETHNIPIIFLTSADTPKNIIDCFELEVDNFLTKPISPKLLINQITLILEERRMNIS